MIKKTQHCINPTMGRWVILLSMLILAPLLRAAPAGVDWQWVNPKPQGNPFNAIAYNSATTTSIAVGDLGGIVASSDAGATWTAQTSGTTLGLNSVWEFGTGFVAVGDQGTILMSFTPPSWGPITSGTTANLNDIVRNGTTSGSLFIVVGDNGTVLSSTDGLNWSAQTTPSGAGNLMSVAWSPSLGLFAAVSDAGKILASTDGISWTFEFFTAPVNGVTAPSGFRAVTWDSTNAQFVAVGVSGIVETSTDGANWSQQTAPASATFASVAQQGGILVAVGKFRGRIETSTDGGTTWTEQFSGSGLLGVTSDGSQFLATGRGGRILRSSDGVTWTQLQPTTSLTVSSAIVGIDDVVWNGTQFLAVGGAIIDGSGNATTLSSVDGISWVLNSVDINGAPNKAVIWDGSQFVGVSGQSAYISPDGTVWTKNIVGSSVPFLMDIVWDGAQYIALGVNGRIFTSPDAVSWTQRTSGTSDEFNAIAGNGSITIAVNSSGFLLSSSDGGVNWTASAIPIIPLDITWNGSQFVVVGGGGQILTSPDGVNWTSRTSSTTNSLDGVFWDGAQFIAVSFGGDIITSPDGVTWSSQTSGTTNRLIAVAGTSTRLVAVGIDGTILTSAGNTSSVSSSGGGGGCTVNSHAAFDPTLLLWLLIGGVLLARKIAKV